MSRPSDYRNIKKKLVDQLKIVLLLLLIFYIDTRDDLYSEFLFFSVNFFKCM